MIILVGFLILLTQTEVILYSKGMSPVEFDIIEYKKVI